MKVLLLLAVVGFCAASNLFYADNVVKSVSQNYDALINDKIVQQITAELQASYMYQAYSHFFARADVALPGFSKWFAKASSEERDHANGLIEYINMRGGVVSLNDIQFSSACADISSRISEVYPQRTMPCICYFMSQKKEKLKQDECSADMKDWRSGLWAMQDTLILERYVNEKLLNLHKAADLEDDAHFTHVLEHQYLDEQVNSIKGVADNVRQLQRAGEGLGEYMFDQQL